MSNVNLAIGGRQYTVACTPGEEARVTGLGEIINAKIQSMGTGATQNEVRMLLFAAIFLADELHELKNGAKAAATPAFDASRLESIAERLENLASALEG